MVELQARALCSTFLRGRVNLSLSCTCSDTHGPVQSLNGTLLVRNPWPPKALKLTSGRRSDAVVVQVEHTEFNSGCRCSVGNIEIGLLCFLMSLGPVISRRYGNFQKRKVQQQSGHSRRAVLQAIHRPAKRQDFNLDNLKHSRHDS